MTSIHVKYTRLGLVIAIVVSAFQIPRDVDTPQPCIYALSLNAPTHASASARLMTFRPAQLDRLDSVWRPTPNLLALTR